MFKTSIRPPTDIVSEFIVLSRDGRLYCMSGYPWDGATWYPDTKSIRRASLGHDALCQLIRDGLLEAHWLPQVNLDFKAWALESGIALALRSEPGMIRAAKKILARAQAETVYLGVKMFSGVAIAISRSRGVLEVP